MDQKQFFAELAKDEENFEVLDNCIWCGSARYQLWGEQSYPGFVTVECEDCNIVYVRKRFNEKGRKELCDGYMAVRQHGERAKQRQTMYQIDLDFIFRCVRSGRVLDAGCGGGYLLEQMPNDCWVKWGTELDTDSVERAKRVLQTEKISEGEIEQIELPLNYFDLVIARGVIEHVPYPRKFIDRIAELVSSEGWVFISGPNIASFCAQFYKDRWKLHYPEAHLTHLSVNHLDMVLQEYGFSLVSDVYHYLETPYASPKDDIVQIARDIEAAREGKREDMSKESPPFFGNRYTAIWEKGTIR